jgi:hypothetical protein
MYSVMWPNWICTQKGLFFKSTAVFKMTQLRYGTEVPVECQVTVPGRESGKSE